jgi:myo-inositol 2-dehydrogenase/D-chiro-inositol 1-dehydrogenase
MTRILRATNTTPALRLGIVGCGRIAAGVHLPGLRGIRDWRVTAAADTDAERLRATTTRFGIPREYRDYRALIDDDEVDVVAVCAPPRMHADVAIAALAAGKHVFVEKPLAPSIGECDRIVRAASASPAAAMVGFNLRWHRSVRRARDLIRDGAVGKVEFIRTAFTTSERVSPSPESNAREYVGVLLDLGVHHFDLLRFLTGADIDTVSASLSSIDSRSQTCVVSIRMRDDVVASSVFSDRAREANELEICGRAGCLRVSCYDFNGLALMPVRPPTGAGRLARMLTPVAAAARRVWRGGDFRAAYAEQWRHLAASIRARRAPACTPEDGLHAVSAAVTAMTSALESRPLGVTVRPSIAEMVS